jgi:hypothetical protein
MTSEKHHIDQLFEQSLGNLKVEPSAMSWQKVAQNLDHSLFVSSKRRSLIKWATIAAAVVTVAIYLFIRSCSFDGAAARYQITERLTIATSTPINKIAKSDLASNKNLKFLAISSPKKSDNVKTSTSNNRSDQQIAAIFISKPLEFDKDNSNLASINQIQKDPQINILTAAIENNPSEIINLNIITQDNPTEDILLHEEPVNNVTNENQIVKSTLSEDSKSEILKTDSVFSPLKPSIASSTSGKRLVTGLNAEVLIGPAVTFSNVSQKAIYESPLLNAHLGKTTPTGELTVNLKYRVSNYYLAAGIQVSDFNQTFDFNQYNEMHDTSGGYMSWNLNRFWTYDTIGFYDDPFNPGLVYAVLLPTYHIDTLSSQWNSRDEIYFTQTSQNSTNKYRYIEIPITIGYVYNIKKATLYAGGGLGFGKMINTTGKYISNNQITEIEPNSNPFLNNNLNYILNIGAGYSLSNRFNILLQANYKANITSIYKPEFGDIKYTNLGIQLGLSLNIK